MLIEKKIFPSKIEIRWENFHRCFRFLDGKNFWSEKFPDFFFSIKIFDLEKIFF